MTTAISDTDVVEQEMQTVIYYLTAFGYIDGTFDDAERTYVKAFIEKLVSFRVRIALKDADETVRADETARWTNHFQEIFAEVDATIRDYFTESVAGDEDAQQFVFAKLKLRCYELFQQFSPDNQKKLLAIADELVEADGVVHPNEAAFREELQALLDADVDVDEDAAASVHGAASDFVIDPAKPLVPRLENYEFFKAFEQPYERERVAFAKQARADLNLIDKTIAKLAEQRAAGSGRLGAAQSVAEFAEQDPFLDGHVYVVPPKSDRAYDLLVLGDLHGCYSCLKAALMQVDFFARVDAHHLDPDKNPAMKVVFLGDYIDRGRFSYSGILRTVMQLFLVVPDHVYILRGNHEFYVELNGRVYGGVKPAEAIESLKDVADNEVFVAFKKLFEALPNTLLFGKTMFVHAGIPRDDTLEAKWKQLSSLNDPEIRFQMLWSDPSEVDVVPLELQKANARFPFGRAQFRDFMARVGATTMIRGHERVVEGFKTVYDDPEATLLSLFSAGGATNGDLFPGSNYREVTPMALVISHRAGRSTVTPFEIDYARYNNAAVNGFFAAPLP